MLKKDSLKRMLYDLNVVSNLDPAKVSIEQVRSLANRIINPDVQDVVIESRDVLPNAQELFVQAKSEGLVFEVKKPRAKSVKAWSGKEDSFLKKLVESDYVWSSSDFFVNATNALNDEFSKNRSLHSVRVRCSNMGWLAKKKVVKPKIVREDVIRRNSWTDEDITTLKNLLKSYCTLSSKAKKELIKNVAASMNRTVDAIYKKASNYKFLKKPKMSLSNKSVLDYENKEDSSTAVEIKKVVKAPEVVIGASKEVEKPKFFVANRPKRDEVEANMNNAVNELDLVQKQHDFLMFTCESLDIILHNFSQAKITNASSSGTEVDKITIRSLIEDIKKTLTKGVIEFLYSEFQFKMWKNDSESNEPSLFLVKDEKVDDRGPLDLLKFSVRITKKKKSYFMLRVKKEFDYAEAHGLMNIPQEVKKKSALHYLLYLAFRFRGFFEIVLNNYVSDSVSNKLVKITHATFNNTDNTLVIWVNKKNNHASNGNNVTFKLEPKRGVTNGIEAH